MKEQSRSSTALLVRGSSPTHLSIKSLLEQSGCQVVDAADEREALRLARQFSVDLLLLNHVAHPLDAINLGCRIRAGAGLSQQVPVVVLYPAQDTETIEHMVGASSYVISMGSYDQLRSLMNRLLLGSVDI